MEPAIGDPEQFGMTISGVDDVSSPVALYEYDGFNQLVATTVGDTTITYTYNGDGLRTSKQVNGSETRHVWDGDQIALELNAAGQVIAKYVRGINLVFAETGAGQSFYLFNGHGDVVQLTDITGIVVKAYDYDAFGNESNIDPADTNPFRYCGEYFDSETGTYYLRARYCAPVVGRFITEDTLSSQRVKLAYGQEVDDPLGLNMNTYCAANPVRYIDTDGHAFMLVTGAIGLVAGGISGAIHSYVKYGAVRWQNVAAGAAIGGP